MSAKPYKNRRVQRTRRGGRVSRQSINWDNVRARLLRLVAKSGMSASHFARVSGVAGTTLTEFLNGNRSTISLTSIGALYAFMGEPIDSFADPEEVRVLGVVADQGHVVLAPTARPTRAKVPCPTGYLPDDIWALELASGTSYPPFVKGWIVFAFNANDPTPELAGELCVCKLAGVDEYLLRTLEVGRAPDTWNLHSPFAETMRNVRLESAAQVIHFDGSRRA